MTWIAFTDTDGDSIWFLVCRKQMFYYVNEQMKVQWLTSMTFDGNTINLDGTSAGSWGSARRTTARTPDVVQKIRSWWTSLQKDEMFGFVDTDGDQVAFQLNGRYLNYWVKGELKVKDLNKLELRGRTFHIDGTSTGSHTSARVTTAPDDFTTGSLDFIVQLFRKRPQRAVMCIGSAGHGSGTAKGAANAKDSTGLLDTKDDIEDCKRYMIEHNSFYEFIGAYEVSGIIGSADDCKRQLQKFFEYCKEKRIAPIVYYTGHGDCDGDWRFPNGGYLTYDQVKALNVSGWKLEIWADCCYAGQWAKKANGTARVIAAASGEKKAINRVFARAVFNGSQADQDRLWSGDIDAISADFDVTSTDYFRGDRGPVVKS